MATATLTARVPKLETTVAALLSSQQGIATAVNGKAKDAAQAFVIPDFDNLPKPGRDDWMTVVGMFAGDEMMQRIDEHCAAIRRAERRKAQRG